MPWPLTSRGSCCRWVKQADSDAPISLSGAKVCVGVMSDKLTVVSVLDPFTIPSIMACTLHVTAQLSSDTSD